MLSESQACFKKSPYVNGKLVIGSLKTHQPNNPFRFFKHFSRYLPTRNIMHTGHKRTLFDYQITYSSWFKKPTSSAFSNIQFCLSQSKWAVPIFFTLICCRVIVFAGQIWNLIEGRNAGHVGAFLHCVHIDEYVKFCCCYVCWTSHAPRPGNVYGLSVIGRDIDCGRLCKRVIR